MTDWDLLRQYVQDGSEAAFAELVRRHIDMVHSACARRLKNAEDAKDATQAVFITLSQKAKSIREGKRVSRALDQLRGALRSAEGTALSATMIEQVLRASVHPAPPGLDLLTTKAVLAGGGAASGAAVLAKGAALAMALSKAKTVAIGALVLLLAGSGAVGTYYAVRPRPRIVVTVPSGPPPVFNDARSGQWQPRFYQVYALAPGENVKVVVPPLGWEREMFFLDDCRKNLTPGWKISQNELLGLNWDGSALHWHMIGFNGDLGGGLASMDFHPWEFDASIPLKLSFPGDWVCRKDITAEQRMAAIGKIVSQKLRRPVHFERQKRPVEVLEVSGTYPETTRVVEMTDGLTKPPPQKFPQQGSMDNFMMILADRLGYKPVNHVSDTASPSAGTTASSSAKPSKPS